jgi:hydroxymethylbilane synthase
MKTKLTLGTRKSLLAWSQSQWVASQVERLNPGVQVELLGIETRGDKILDVSLQNMEGKEFFVAEIDDALISSKVDFTVHSLKDLSLERPKVLTSAATPERENPRDVVLFGPHILARLKAGKTLKIGTSSPRRIKNIPSFLRRALPQTQPVDLDFVEIRGNVNTRLSRVHESPDSLKYLDAVVLAFAGLIRLWANPAGQTELKRHLSGVKWMVLPLKECPAAPGQGTLAIECRAEDEPVKKILQTLHHQPTAKSVAAERQILSDWGGGCHQKFGATSVDYGWGELLYIRGEKPDQTQVAELRWNSPRASRVPGGAMESQNLSPPKIWDGSEWRGKTQNGAVTDGSSAKKFPHINLSRPVFVAHSRALAALDAPLPTELKDARIWTSGTASWFRLAEKGYWVEGSAEGLGFEELSKTLEEPVLRLDENSKWLVLTHSGALSEWVERGIEAISTYNINSNYGTEALSALKAATHVFWSSGSQFDELKEYLGPKVHISCGPGHTAAKLIKAGMKPILFPSVEEWKKWLKI